MNGKALEAHVKSRLGIGFHQTTVSGSFTVEPVYCLGNCACSPSVMLDEEIHGRVTPDRFWKLLQEARQQE